MTFQEKLQKVVNTMEMLADEKNGVTVSNHDMMEYRFSVPCHGKISERVDAFLSQLLEGNTELPEGWGVYRWQENTAVQKANISSLEWRWAYYGVVLEKGFLRIEIMRNGRPMYLESKDNPVVPHTLNLELAERIKKEINND